MENHIFVVDKRYCGICKDLNAGIILTQICYWIQRSKHTDISGQKFVYKRYSEWKIEVGITEKQAKKAISILRDLGVISTRTSMFNAFPSLAISVNKERINALISELPSEPLSLVSGQQNSVDSVPKGLNPKGTQSQRERTLSTKGNERKVPKGTNVKYQRDETITELTAEPTQELTTEPTSSVEGSNEPFDGAKTFEKDSPEKTEQAKPKPKAKTKNPVETDPLKIQANIRQSVVLYLWSEYVKLDGVPPPKFNGGDAKAAKELAQKLFDLVVYKIQTGEVPQPNSMGAFTVDLRGSKVAFEQIPNSKANDATRATETPIMQLFARYCALLFDKVSKMPDNFLSKTRDLKIINSKFNDIYARLSSPIQQPRNGGNEPKFSIIKNEFSTERPKISFDDIDI